MGTRITFSVTAEQLATITSSLSAAKAMFESDVAEKQDTEFLEHLEKHGADFDSVLEAVALWAADDGRPRQPQGQAIGEPMPPGHAVRSASDVSPGDRVRLGELVGTVSRFTRDSGKYHDTVVFPGGHFMSLEFAVSTGILGRAP